METNCKIIEDLLPLYADTVCSEESAKLITKHLAQCDKCKQSLQNIQKDVIKPSKIENKFPSDSEKILKKVSQTLNKKAVYSAVGILIIILYWLFYTWLETLAKTGDYRYFSGDFYEIYPIGTVVFPIITLIWLIIHIRNMYRSRTWKKGPLLLATLFLLFCGQFGYLYCQSQIMSMTCVATVKETLDDAHIIILCGEQEILLSAPPSVINLLKTDGTRYCFSYETYKSNREEGTLCVVVTDSPES